MKRKHKEKCKFLREFNCSLLTIVNQQAVDPQAWPEGKLNSFTLRALFREELKNVGLINSSTEFDLNYLGSIKNNFARDSISSIQRSRVNKLDAQVSHVLFPDQINDGSSKNKASIPSIVHNFMNKSKIVFW